MGQYYSQPPEMRAKISRGVKRRLAEDPELLRQASESRKGKPSRGGHVTSHQRRENPKPETCGFCREAIQDQEPWTRNGADRG